MSNPQTPVKNRNQARYTSPASPVTYDPPILWFSPVGDGNVVLKDERGTAVTYTSLTGYEGGIVGPFTELTSFTTTGVMLGDGAPPAPPTAAGAASGATIADAGNFTAQTTVEGALQELYQDAKSTQGVIPLPASTFYLLTGAPLAVFADGTTTVPGSTMEGGKAFGVRWNNDAAPAAITRGFQIPPDMDITANATFHGRIAKTGATNNAGNTTTLVVGVFNQVDSALYDADTDFGGTSSAILPAATAKTIQNVTLTLALADLAAFPASATITIKPTAGTLNTDDLVLLDAYIQYKKKPLAS
jgi:hypothetical protein